MVGVVLVNDIQCAHHAGYQAVLVQTGKYREALVRQSDISPNGIITTEAELPNFLSAITG